MKNIKLIYEDVLEFDRYGDYEIYTEVNTVKDFPKRQGMHKFVIRANNERADYENKNWYSRKWDDKHPYYYANMLLKKSNGKSVKYLLKKFKNKFPNDEYAMRAFRNYFYPKTTNWRTCYDKVTIIDGIVYKNDHKKRNKFPKLRLDDQVKTFDLDRKSKEWKKLHSEYVKNKSKIARMYYEYSFYPWDDLQKHNKLKKKEKRNKKQNKTFKTSLNHSLHHSLDMLKLMSKEDLKDNLILRLNIDSLKKVK